MLSHNPAAAAFAGFAPAPALARLFAMLRDGSVWGAVTPSALRVGAGLAFAIAIGAPLGVLVGQHRLFREASWSAPYHERVLRARLEGSNLALDAAQAAMLHARARAYVEGSAYSRRLRESYFIAIVTPATKHLQKDIAGLQRCRRFLRLAD